jgi:hypothetical protein
MNREDSKGVCAWCGEPVEPNERADNVNALFHADCLIRAVVGSVGHQRGECSCHGGEGNGEPEGVTLREGARLAAAEWRRREEQGFHQRAREGAERN